MKMRKILSAFLAVAMLASASFVGVTVNAAEKLPFTDVSVTWYTEAVASVYSEGIMKGKTETTFDPTAKITRAEVVTAFARVAIAKTSGMGDELPFDDTAPGQWYSESVGWAAASGIVAGRGDGRFSPADNITRAELASILTKFIDYMGVTLPDNAKIDSFKDANTFDSWMVGPIEAVRKNGLMQGTDGKFNPRGNATRAEIAQVIKNLLPDVGRQTVVENGKSDYVIVIDEGNTAAVDAAERMVWQLEKTCGVTMTVADDSASPKAKEIVLGKTSRGERIDTSDMIRDEYAVVMEDVKVYVDGASADGLYRGAVSFMNTCTSGDDVRFTVKSQITDKFEYPIGKITVAGNDISKYTVYYPAGADDNVKGAAEDIAYYIEEACGVKLPVKTGSAGDYAIVIKTIASDKEFDDSFSVKSEGNSIVISGHANLGAVYGAYDFLEQCIGCTFAEYNVDYIEPKDELALDGIDYSESPAVTYRAGTCAGYTSFTEISFKNKGFRNYRWGTSNCHTFDQFDGKYSSQYENQPCLTDPNVYDTILKNVLATLKQYRETNGVDAEIISLSMNDNFEYCKCDNCMASYMKYTKDPKNVEMGGTAGTLIAFLNKIIPEIQKEYPDLKVSTLAYIYNLVAPANITLHEDISILFCPIFSCNNHKLELQCAANKDVYQAVKDWSELAGAIQMWEYPTNWYWDYFAWPVYAYDDFAVNYQFYCDSGLNYVFYNGSPASDDIPAMYRGSFCLFDNYMGVKVMWNPYMTEEEYYGYMKSYLKACNGPGWEDEFKAMMLVEEKFDRCLIEDGNGNSPASNMFHLYMRSYIDEVVDLFESAKLKAETKYQWQRVDEDSVAYRVVQLDGVFNSMYKSTDPAVKAELREICTELYESMARYAVFYQGYENLTAEEVGEFDRIPSEWRGWIQDKIEEKYNIG